MKLTTIPIAALIFSVVAFGLTSVLSEANSPYNTIGTDLNETYNKVNEITQEYQSYETNIRGTESEDSGGNFLTNLGRMWSTIKLIFKSTSIATDVSKDVSEDLFVPGILRIAFLGLVSISFLAFIISLTVRWRSD